MDARRRSPVLRWRRRTTPRTCSRSAPASGTTTRLTRSPGRAWANALPRPVSCGRPPDARAERLVVEPREPRRPRVALLVRAPEDPVRPVLDPPAAALSVSGIAGGDRPQPARSAAPPFPADAYAATARRAAPRCAPATTSNAPQAAPARRRRRLGGRREAARARAGGFAGVVAIDADTKSRPASSGLLLAHRPAPAGPLRPEHLK